MRCVLGRHSARQRHSTVSKFHDKVVDALLFGGYEFSYIYDELSCYFDG